MISSEVQRTLVKSPPELWTELSDPVALARHLGEFGEIRITRVEPEKLVEWQAENTTGRVSMKASGWGTKVTLSVTQEPTAEEPSSEDASGAHPDGPESAPQADAAAEEAPALSATKIHTAAEVHTQHEVTDTAEEPDTDAAVAETSSQPAPLDGEISVAAQPKRHRGFFARLFGRRAPRRPEAEQAETIRQAEPAPDEPPESEPAPRTAVESLQARFIVEPAAQPPVEADTSSASVEIDDETEAVNSDVVEAQAVETEAVEAQAVETEAVEAQAVELETVEADAVPVDGGVAGSLEPESVETVTAERASAVLTGVLDRLGAAHHRPFSRA